MTEPYQDEVQATPSIKDRLGDPFRIMVVRAIERCLTAKMTGDSYVYQAAVEGLLNILPMHKRLEILNSRGEWEYEVTAPKFKHSPGTTIRIGSVGDPRMLVDDPNLDDFPLVSDLPEKDRPYLKDEEGRLVLDDNGKPQIDWSDPRIFSPHMVTETHVNTDRLFTMCQEAVEEVGMTYTKTAGMKDAGPMPARVPRAFISPVVEMIVDMVQQAREAGFDVGYRDFTDILADEAPETPVRGARDE